MQVPVAVPLPAAKIDTVFPVTIKQPVHIREKHLEVRTQFVERPGGQVEVELQAECKPDTVEVPVEVEKIVHTSRPLTWWEKPGYMAVFLAALILVLILIIKLFK